MNFDYKQIDQYIQGKLEGEALANFEAKLLTDKALAEEVALYKDVEMTLTSAYTHEEEDAALAQTFGQLGKKYFGNQTATIQEADSAKVKQDHTKVVRLEPTKERTTKQSSGLWWLRPAIGLSVAALIALLIFQPWQADFIQPFDTPYELAMTVRSGGEEELIAAQKAYNSGDYAAAIPIFEKYSDSVEIQLAKGNAQYYLGNIDAAINTFEQIANGGSVYTSTANWYLAGAYLEQNQTEKAKAALALISTSSEHYEAARKLLRKLGN